VLHRPRSSPAPAPVRHRRALLRADAQLLCASGLPARSTYRVPCPEPAAAAEEARLPAQPQ